MAERSPGGSEMFQHAARTAPFQPATGDPQIIEEVVAHIEKHLGPVHKVFHEIVSDMVHIDVHHVEPSTQRPFHILVTSGMSEAPMSVPPGYPGPKLLELCICLPPDWRYLTESEAQAEGPAAERLYWPIRWLKTLARLPHEYSTFLGVGHTVPNGDPPSPVADNVGFCAMLVTLPYGTSAEFTVMKARERETWFLGLIPLFKEELELKLNKGLDALEALLDRRGLMPWDYCNGARPNLAKKKRWFGR